MVVGSKPHGTMDFYCYARKNIEVANVLVMQLLESRFLL